MRNLIRGLALPAALGGHMIVRLILANQYSPAEEASMRQHMEITTETTFEPIAPFTLASHVSGQN